MDNPQDGAPVEIEVVDLPRQRVVAARHVGPYDGMGEAFQRVGLWARAHASAVVGPPLAVYLDDPTRTPVEDLRTDVAVPINDGVMLPGVPGAGVPGVSESILAGGRYAVLTHRGPYSGLADAWPAMRAGLAARGLVPDEERPCFEVYRSDPDQVAEADLETVLHQPLR